MAAHTCYGTLKADDALTSSLEERSSTLEHVMGSTSTDSRFSSTRTIPLQDNSLLRGTTSAVLLENFGGRLRGSAGGIGCVSREGDDEYRRSFITKVLDVFLSHSWHAEWYWKYMLLLIHFNARPALIASIIMACLCAIVSTSEHRHNFGIPLQRGLAARDVCYAQPHMSSLISLPFLGGMCTFITVIFSWHFLRSVLGLWNPAIFLDKVCIHQTDAVQKAKGILSIGALLSNTDTMLIALDKSYFSRLWCVYEISAYKFCKPHGKTCIRSMRLPSFIIAFGYIGGLTYVFVRVTEFSDKALCTIQLACLACAMLPMVRFVSIFRAFAQERRELKWQVKNFSARNAKCFCCTVNHVLPDTGETLQCDRKYVYSAIASWYGEGDEDIGLEAFDEMVRVEMWNDLKHSMGKSYRLPYYMTLIVGLVPFMLHLDWARDCTWVYRFVVAVEILFLRFPLCMSLTLFVCNTATFDDESRLIRGVLDFAMAVFASLVVAATTYTTFALGQLENHKHFTGANHGLYICWFLLQGFLAWLIYYLLPRIQVQQQVTDVKSRVIAALDRAKKRVKKVTWAGHCTGAGEITAEEKMAISKA